MTPALPSEPHRGFRDRFKPVGIGIVRFVGVKVEIEVAVARQREDTFKVRLRIVDHHGAKDAAVIGNQIGQPLPSLPGIVIEHRERHALQGDAAGPAIAHVRQHRPADRALRTH